MIQIDLIHHNIESFKHNQQCYCPIVEKRTILETFYEKSSTRVTKAS